MATSERLARRPWPTLAALGDAEAAGLAGAEGREVVVEQEALAVLAGDRVDDLLVAAGAQRGHHQGLRLAAGEQRRAVGARQHAGADLDRAHGAGVAAVDARLAVEDAAAHDARLEVEEDVLELVDRGRVLHAFGELADHALADLGQAGRALLLAGDAEGLFHLGLGELGDLGDQRLVGGRQPASPTRACRRLRPAR
jgi:hypothetical protein